MIANDGDSDARLRGLRHIRLLGVRIHVLSLRDLLDVVRDVLRSNTRAFVTYVNAHGMNLAVEQADLRQILNDADVVFCDGHGVRIGALLRGIRIPHRFTPPDWIDALCEVCIERDCSMFLLGGRQGIAAQAANRLRDRFPRLRVAGTHHGHFDKRSGSPENAAVLELIRGSRPNVLLVGFGMPLQEQWVAHHRSELPVNVVITVGAMFDYVAGTVYRAPRWLTDNGFEWLARLIVEPRRLWRRYVIGNPLFLWRVMTWRRDLGDHD